MRRLIAGLALTFAVLLPQEQNLQAQIWDTGPPSDPAFVYFILDSYRLAVPFYITTPTTVQMFTFWGTDWRSPRFDPGPFHGIYWEILGDAAGAPGTSLASGSSTDRALYPTALYPISSAYERWWEHNISTGPVPLGVGSFWLALHHGPWTDGAWDDEYFMVTGSAPPQDLAYDEFPFDTWAVNENSGYVPAYQIWGDPSVVPEPSTVLLLGTGLLGLGFVAWRRKEEED